ncbi:MAG: DUF3226 domain-containing protein [Phycisphaerae bacterium]
MAVTGSTTAKNELPTRIHCDRLLLVEGKDEKGFFDKWLLQIVASSVQIVDIGGKDKFHTKFPTITNLPGFRNVQRLGIIRDAEESYTSTFQSIKNTLRIGASITVTISARLRWHFPIDIGTVYL